MTSSITSLIVLVSILYSVLCYTHTNVQSLNGFFDNKDKRTEDVILRSSTQAGPPADGSLTFVETPDQLQDGKLTCRVGEECTYRCVAEGSNIAELKVERLRGDGTVELLGDTSYQASSQSSLRPNVARLEKNVSFHVDSIPGVPGKIQCTARNDDDDEVTMEIPLIIYVPVEIISEESGIEVAIDPDDGNRKLLTLYCTVKGSPLPHVTFSWSNIFGEGEYSAAPEEMARVGDMTYKMMVHDTIYGNATTFGPYFYMWFANCDATQEPPIYDFKWLDLMSTSNY